jgi:hypothetical protein
MYILLYQIDYLLGMTTINSSVFLFGRLSLRSWTHGWDIYAPRKDYFAHQYRPGSMGLPKFWESLNRVFGGRNNGFDGKV